MAQTNRSFQGEFFSLAKHIGESAKSIQDKLGKHDDISEDEYRAFIWYKENKTSIYVGNDGIIGHMMAPLKDAYGRSIDDFSDYYKIDGAILGMSKNEVKKVWGETEREGTYVLNYEKKGGITNKGQQFYISAYFSGDEPNLILSYFGANIKSSEKHSEKSNNELTTDSGFTNPILKYLLMFLKFFFETLGKIGSWLLKYNMRKLRELLKI